MPLRRPFPGPSIPLRSVALACAIAACGLPAAAADEPPSRMLAFYRDIGRLQWDVPRDSPLTLAVPHFTAGPRLRCSPKAEASCEIQVAARDLSVERAQRRAELLGLLRANAAELTDPTTTVRTFGEAPAVEYVSALQRESGRRVAFGHYVRGPFVVKFEFVADDPNGAKLGRMLALVRSTTALDGTGFLAFRLADFKAACDEVQPSSRAASEQAFAATGLAAVDYVAVLAASDPKTSLERFREATAKTRASTIDDMRKWPQETSASFCLGLPKQMRAAVEP